MRRDKVYIRRLLAVLFVGLVCICLLACAVAARSGRLQATALANIMQGGTAEKGMDIFWNGENAPLSRGKVTVFDIRYKEQDKEILLTLAGYLRERLKKSGITVLFLGTESDMELRSELLNRDELSLYIALSTGEAAAEVFGTKCFYNDEYYLPQKNSVWLCDRLLQNVVASISGKALGMEECEARDLLIGLEAPACILQVGYLTNAREYRMLRKEAYLESMAEGIAATVEEYYDDK